LYLICCGILQFGVGDAVEKVSKDLMVTNVERSIDIASQLVKINTKLTLSNEGQSTLKFFHFTVEEGAFDKIFHIGASSGRSGEKSYLRTSLVTLDNNVKGWKVELDKPLVSSQAVTVEVDLIVGHALEMYPTEIEQKDKQLVMYSGSHYAYLPYKCKTQTTKVTLSSSTIESYSKLKPVSQSDTIITYGPYSNVEAFSFDEMTVHYENNNPFLVVSKLERTVELSMWGNIAIEETLDVRHAGAKLKGSFSRYEFQRENSGVSAVKMFKSVLPAAASDVYYRDDIGNISTSALRFLEDSVEVELRPRFPLFGGWKTHYLLGYNVPSYEYLFSKGDNFVLNMRLLDHVFDDMLVEDFTLKIILPEGSQVGKLHTPYPVKRGKDSLHYTYLDTNGRPVIEIKNSGPMTEKHIEDFQLEFKFSRLSMAREPLLLILSFFIFFALAIIYVRLDFAITKDEGTEVRLKVAGYCEKIAGHQEKRLTNYSNYDDAIAKLKSSKDAASFQSTIKKLAVDQKNDTSAISDLANVLKTVAPDVADKISELQKFDRTYREHQTNQSGLVEKLVSGKLGKQQFIDQEGAIVKKKDECLDKMNSILAHLRSL